MREPLPQGWGLHQLGDLFEMQLGKMLSKEASSGPNRAAYLANRHVQWDRVVLNDLDAMSFSAAEREKFSLRDGDLLVCEGGEVGRTALWRGEAEKVFFQKAIHRLRPRDSAIEPRYMLRFMRRAADTGAFTDLSSQTSIAHLTREKLALLTVATPPLPEQRQIAAILDTLDDAIRKTEQIIAKLKQVKQGLLHDLLTRGIDDNGELRDPDRHPEQFKESALGRIPKGWEVLAVGALLASVDPAMRSGPFGSALLKSELVEAGVPLLGIDNVQVEHFEPMYTRFVTPKKAQQLGRYLVRPCDVMITIMGTVGRCCVVPHDMGAALSTKHVWTLTFDPERYDPDLACVQINHAPWVLRHFARDEQGGIMSAIRSETLRTTLLPVPPPSEMRFIAGVLKEVSARIAIETTMVAKRKLEKAGLMEDLLTGRVRVTSLVDCPPAELPT